MQELNVYRGDGGWLDWKTLADGLRARSGDSLTLYSVRDLGPRGIRAFAMLGTLAMRGVEIDHEAICPTPWELFLLHKKYVDSRKGAAMRAAKDQPGVDQGGRPHIPDAEILRAYNQIKAGEYTMRDFEDFNDYSTSAFWRGVERLDLPSPTQRAGTE